MGLGGSEEKEHVTCLHLYMPHHAHLVIARSDSVGHRVACLMAARHTDKAAVRQGDIAQLPSDIEVLTIDATILLAVVGLPTRDGKPFGVQGSAQMTPSLTRTRCTSYTRTRCP